jgi:hypothetical protein
MDDRMDARFSVLIGAANERKEHPVARRMFDKVDCRILLEELRAPVVERFELLGSLDRLEPEMIAQPTVVKPRRGFNDRGVAVLVPIAPMRWVERLSGRELDFEGVRGLLAASVLARGVPDAWVMEGLVPGTTPDSPVDDIKLCLFGDVVACSFVRSNAPRGYQWFDEAWLPVDTGIHALHLEPGIEAPACRFDLVEVARAISRQLRLPFIRVDFLANPDVFVVGELTPYPGWYRDFAPEWDRKLGRLYVQAESDLLAREFTSEAMEWKALA